ncbi:cytochrome c biogenesis CcdA family protein [Inmirania thermothiophila]|uniref:Cytochrome c-type biogenesis protein n=1 Tax=Inmirania thermothiophila TaxID=1750597 RepID=A0A3N1XSP6_9GAMM|nr:cytochrome c biogenesis protein CcdA [Inmirania thermothiophila]ROR29674.1 cytochrome c-type biogenesis protein [Inmirania thermothiophila]
MVEISGIGIASAFLAGLISFLSPCVLPLVPGYLSYVAGRSVEDLTGEMERRARLATLLMALLFVLGFSTVFVALGASATAVGQLLARYRYETNLVGGAIVTLFGLFMTGLVRIPWLERDVRIHRTIGGAHPLASYLLGMAFAFGWTPCIGPILGAILTVSATAEQTATGMALLAIYSAGLGVPFLLAALFTDRFLHHARSVRRFAPTLHKIAGWILVVFGIAMMTGLLSRFAFWLLTVFPWLAEIG